MIPLKAVIAIDYLFWAVKFTHKRLQKFVHDSMLPSDRPLNYNLGMPTITNKNNLHLKAS